MVIFGSAIIFSCGQSEESISREERVMKKGFFVKTCGEGSGWMSGHDFGSLIANAVDSERNCEWAFNAWGYVLNDEKEKDCFCNGYLNGYDYAKKQKLYKRL